MNSRLSEHFYSFFNFHNSPALHCLMVLMHRMELTQQLKLTMLGIRNTFESFKKEQKIDKVDTSALILFQFRWMIIFLLFVSMWIISCIFPTSVYILLFLDVLLYLCFSQLEPIFICMYKPLHFKTKLNTYWLNILTIFRWSPRFPLL